MRFIEQSVETMPREALELLQTEKLYSMLEKFMGETVFIRESWMPREFVRKRLRRF
ncbi:MAG: hypothetical protein L7T82_05510 [SAR324 cluster bacterium]|nr:hypothetical protein [SAR324 cluster bacterium]